MNGQTVEPPTAVEVPSTPVMDMWTKKMKFPKNRYILRLADTTFKTSSKGNAMIEFGYEIVGPKSSVGIKQEDKTISQVGIIGLKVSNWLTLLDSNKQYQRDLLKTLGLPVVEIDPASPDLSVFKGIIVNAIVSCDEREELSDEFDEVTGKAKPICDDYGKPIINYQLRMGDIISRNTSFLPPTPY